MRQIEKYLAGVIDRAGELVIVSLSQTYDGAKEAAKDARGYVHWADMQDDGYQEIEVVAFYRAPTPTEDE